MKIAEIKDNLIKLSDNTIFNSQSLKKYLNNSEELYLTAITSGPEITEYTDELMNKNEMSKAVIVDAAASEITEMAATFIHSFLKKELLKEGKIIEKKRYSPGYGDFTLSDQKKIDNILDLKQIGIVLSPNHILIPEKSITAIIGIIK